VFATADDFGRSAAIPDELPRAGQNVIFELGYFFAALGRPCDALVYGAGVERPSDTDGIPHIAIHGAARGRFLTRICPTGAYRPRWCSRTAGQGGPGVGPTFVLTAAAPQATV
jgi:hypothetical protein